MDLFWVTCKFWEKLNVFNDTECPYWDKESLSNIQSNSTNSLLPDMEHRI